MYLERRDQKILWKVSMEKSSNKNVGKHLDML